MSSPYQPAGYVRVLPTYVLESDNLVLVPTDNGSLFSHAFALGRQM